MFTYYLPYTPYLSNIVLLNRNIFLNSFLSTIALGIALYLIVLLTFIVIWYKKNSGPLIIRIYMRKPTSACCKWTCSGYFWYTIFIKIVSNIFITYYVTFSIVFVVDNIHVIFSFAFFLKGHITIPKLNHIYYIICAISKNFNPLKAITDIVFNRTS